MAWQYNFNQNIDLFVKNKILPEDADRQKRTAIEILKRLKNQPGLILADEVGMGKTFVALAVALSVALEDKKQRPVVIMLPVALKEKWPKDFNLFKEKCLGQIKKPIQYGFAENKFDFLKLLDDKDERSKQVIFLTHSALNRDSLRDKWAKIALVQRAIFRRKDIAGLKRGLYNNLGTILNLQYAEKKDSEIWEKLLNAEPSKWKNILIESKIFKFEDDDPIPEIISHKLDKMPSNNFSELFRTLEKYVPQRQNKNFEDNIENAQKILERELRKIWDLLMEKIPSKLPLLILDEAHHLKNSCTRFASLFQSQDSQKLADEVKTGYLTNVFERMLFLTATPFQLGHHELCNVLDRFGSISWNAWTTPPQDKIGYEKQLARLRDSLDKAQESAERLDKSWGGLNKEDISHKEIFYEDIDEWWKVLIKNDPDEFPSKLQEIFQRYNDTRQRMKDAEKLLHPFVIRHLKPKFLNDKVTLRRLTFPGNKILSENNSNGSGLEINNESLFPFLMAARLTASTPEDRPVFAEGLASSYETFLRTRKNKFELSRDNDDDEFESNFSEVSRRYLGEIDTFLKENIKDSKITHPKINATVNKVKELWLKGEKVVVFCHYIETGKVLRQYISKSIKEEIEKTCSEKLGCNKNNVWQELEKIGNHFENETYRLRQICDVEIKKIILEYPKLDLLSDKLVEVVRRYLRTPSFLIRFFPLHEKSLKDVVFYTALKTKDASKLTLEEVIKNFMSFLQDNCGEDERNRYIEALLSIQSGNIRGKDVAQSFSTDEVDDIRSEISLPLVRLANGRTKAESRQNLMLTFNTPFYPDVLIASSVMAEGIDLHLNCRFIVHHDLCWNPSTLEQRTGRIDRIGAKVEKCNLPIQIYLPFISETQDEKMYKVVMDRERWFKVVMGEKFSFDVATTDKLALRIPLPIAIADDLAFRLEC